jgi:hypothetical protein
MTELTGSSVASSTDCLLSLGSQGRRDDPPQAREASGSRERRRLLLFVVLRLLVLVGCANLIRLANEPVEQAAADRKVVCLLVSEVYHSTSDRDLAEEGGAHRQGTIAQ